ncbi:long-chain fatty acid--CoA ligase, partial [bacterium]|nr:long-chain fatty acid--CoA ligase [bacterium]
ISIVDRKKDLIVLSNGKKVAPQMVELRLKSDPMIAQAIVCGESRNYLVALIVPDFARIRRIKKLPMHFTETDIAQHPKIVAMIRKIVDKKMRGLANFEQIKTIALLDREFTIDSGELTPSMKPRRKIINHNYASVIEQMYVSSSLAHNQSKESES